MLPFSAHSLSAGQRVLCLALFTPSVLLITLAAVPALMVLPFQQDGTERAIRLLTAYTGHARVLLTFSRPSRPPSTSTGRPSQQSRVRRVRALPRNGE